ncbi:MAG: putative sulfate exporter family transporter [Bacteroidia bacterium]
MPYGKIFFYLMAALSLTPYINSAIALLFGILVGYLFEGHYQQKDNDKYSKHLLRIAIVGLGFTLTLTDVVRVSGQSFGITVASILSVFLLGYWISKKIKLSPKMCFLIAGGTAICGGSAIAAISPVIRAKNKDISTALISIFLLNAVALFVFPFIGRLLNLNDFQFGLWSAIAIHDTSSVAGASAAYSDTSFQIATITKLARTLWIIPLVLAASYFFKSKDQKVNIPSFIIMFVAASVFSTYFLENEIKQYFKIASKEILDAALFFIGTSLKPNNLKHFLSKSFLFSLFLWIFVSVFSLLIIMYLY